MALYRTRPSSTTKSGYSIYPKSTKITTKNKNTKLTSFSAAPPLAPFAPADEDAETDPFFETAVFEIVDFEATDEVAVPAFMGSAAATSFPINFGFFVGGGGDTCKI